MKQLNTFNKTGIVVNLVLIIWLIISTINYRTWERYTYSASVFTPKEFPIYLFGIWFYQSNGDLGEVHFDESQKAINGFRSYWGDYELGFPYKPELPPKSMFLEYVDFRTKNYYCDTILIPKENVLQIFRHALQTDIQRPPFYEPKLQIRVGIANEGHIIFWGVGQNFEKEIYRTQIQHKPFPKALVSYAEPFPIGDKEKFLQKLFDNIPDSTQQRILQQNVENVQYKDSIPHHFKNYHR